MDDQQTHADALRALADRFSEGWHDGIKIDASDVMDLSAAADELEALRKEAERYRWLLANYARGDGYDAIDAALNNGEADTQLSPAIDAAMALHNA